jgi:hypothetical protein
MKRLNPETGKPFKKGNVRKDGFIFKGYQTNIKKDGFFGEIWLKKLSYTKEINSIKNHYKTKRGHLSQYLAQAKYRVKGKNIPFNIDLDFLESITTECCPVFGFKFNWGRDGSGHSPNKPSLDRIIPELGYIKGNVVFISSLANTIKSNATEKELYAIADWLHDKRKEVLNAFKKQSAPISAEHIGEGQNNTEPRTVHGAGTGQDCDGAHHHRGEPEGQDISHSSKEGCRICMGTGMRQVATLADFYGDEANGDTLCTPEELAQRLGCICYQS